MATVKAWIPGTGFVNLELGDLDLTPPLGPGATQAAPGDHIHTNTMQLHRVVYTAGAYPTRPVGVTYCEWVGPTQPSGMIAGDTWIPTNP